MAAPRAPRPRRFVSPSRSPEHRRTRVFVWSLWYKSVVSDACHVGCCSGHEEITTPYWGQMLREKGLCVRETLRGVKDVRRTANQTCN